MNKAVNNIINCHHTLHGYSDGHSLLATSLDLPNDVKRMMLTMSDMSGHSMVKGYEDYITGYQIKELNMYALGKTWYAPEMDRPGCVWTHTILFNFQDLIRLNTVNQILNLFKRPSENLDLEFYNSTIEMHYQNDSWNINVIPSIEFLKYIILEIYEKPFTPLLILEKEKDKHEDLILHLWLQQWPRLRRNFSFCTGAISPRLINNKVLDLQVTPIKKDNISKNIIEVNILDPSKFESKIYESWVELAAKDLLSPSNLREFFVNYGADLKPDRSSFKPLIEIFSLFHNNEAITSKQLIDTVGAKFPNANEALNLKTNVLNRSINHRNVEFPLEEFLVSLSTTEFYQSYTINKTLLDNYANCLCDYGTQKTLDLLMTLLDNDLNVIGVELFRIISNLIVENNDLIFNREYRKLLLVFLHINPELSYSKEFWKVNLAEQEEILSLLLKINKDRNIDWNKIIKIVIEENIDVDFGVILNEVNGVIDFILSSLNNYSNYSINSGLVTMLKNNTTDVIYWLNNNRVVNDNLLQVFLNILNPNSNSISKYGSKLWYDILINSVNKDVYNIIQLKAFCVSVSLNNKDSFELLSKSASSVYWALKNNELDYQSWRYIEIHTKPLFFWNDWDKSKKLLSAIVDKFKEENWPTKYYGKLFSHKEILTYLIYRHNNAI
jgi:hypothetical protein